MAGKGDNLDEFFEQQETYLGGQLMRWCCLSHMIDMYSTDGDRAYGYLRFETGDEMSRRAKFAFVTWIGPSVSALKKAKVSTDKAFVKQVFVVS